MAERIDQRVRRFSGDGKKKKGIFIDGPPDLPEFLLHPDRTQQLRNAA